MATARVGWLSRPVFVTSTFRDTHAERDWVRNYVFLQLAERLLQRRCYLEPIDLRWGVETADAREEEQKQILVLKVCLDEVKRSRPFLIGILGDRYGWVPPPERMEAAAREAGFDQPLSGRSVTALEIDYGVFSDSVQQKRCLFYLREPLPYERMPADVAARYREAPGSEGERALAGLKRRIRDELPDRWRSYRVGWDADNQSVTGLEEFGKQVFEDLWRELDAETRDRVAAPAPTWQEEERATLEQFIEDHTRSFVGRKAILDELRALALSAPEESAAWCACITAPAGAGKSAVFGELHKQLGEKRSTLILAHAAGVSPRSTLVDAMLRRWVGELAEATGEDPPLGESASVEQVENAFGRLLGLASASRRVVLLVDALNQFEPTTRAQHLTWLPRLWPPNARFLATAIPGTASQALLERPGAREIQLPPLDTAEGAEIARGICRRYRRVLNPDVLSVLLEKRADGAPAAGNALWLELAVEELNLLDADDFARLEREEFEGSADERLLRLLVAVASAMPPGVEQLYAWMLERSEELHGRAWAQAFVNLIAVSRAGCREFDFRELLPRLTGEAWDARRFSHLRRTFRAHVVQRGAQAQWDFAHEQMRRAVLRRNLPDQGDAREVHRTLADYLEALPDEDPVHESETMVHLLGSEDRLRTARWYAGELTEREIEGATRALSFHVVSGLSGPQLASVVDLLGQQELSATARARLCHRFAFELDDALASVAPLEIQLRLLEATGEELADLTSGDGTDLRSKRDLSVILERIGDLKKQQGDVRAALETYRRAHKIRSSLALRGPDDPPRLRDLSICRMKIGEALLEQGQVSEALEEHRSALAILERLAAADPHNPQRGWDLSLVHERIGDLHKSQGQLAASLGSYRVAHSIRERLCAADPASAGFQRLLGVTHGKIGDALFEQGDLSGALGAYRAGLAVAERLARQDPGNLAWQRDLSASHLRIGDIFASQRDLSAALRAYEAAQLIEDRLAKRDPANPEWQLDLSVTAGKIGDVRFEQGDAGSALEAYAAARARLQRLAVEHPDKQLWQLNLAVACTKIGDALRQLTDRMRALEEYEAVVSAFPDEPGELAADWMHLLAVTFGKHADVLRELGLIDQALVGYQRTLSILEDLTADDPSNASTRRALDITKSRIDSIARARRSS